VSAEFLQSLANAMPGVAVCLQGPLDAGALLLDKPITLTGTQHGELRGCLVISSPGVVLRNLRLTHSGREPALRVTGAGEVHLDRCTVESSGPGVHVDGGTALLDHTTVTSAGGDAVNARGGAHLTLAHSVITAHSGDAVVAVGEDTKLMVEGGELSAPLGAGVRVEAVPDARLRDVLARGCASAVVASDGATLRCDSGHLTGATRALLHTQTNAVAILTHTCLDGSSGAGILAEGHSVSLVGSTMTGGAPMIWVRSGSLDIDGCRLGPCSEGSRELWVEGGAVARIKASHLTAHGTSTANGLLILIDTGVEGSNHLLEVTGTLRVVGCSLHTTGGAPVLGNGADLELDRCELRGTTGVQVDGGRLVVRRTEIHGGPRGGTRVGNGTVLEAEQTLFFGGPSTLVARAATVCLTDAKIIGDDSTTDAFVTDERTKATLTRCHVEAAKGTALRAGGTLDLANCNLEGATALALESSASGTAKTCRLRGSPAVDAPANTAFTFTDCDMPAD
jgi:hypothetical protein